MSTHELMTREDFACCCNSMHFIIKNCLVLLGSSKFLVTKTCLKDKAKVNWDCAKKRIVKQRIEDETSSDSTSKFCAQGTGDDAYHLA